MPSLFIKSTQTCFQWYRVVNQVSVSGIDMLHSYALELIGIDSVDIKNLCRKNSLIG
jgi:hypothetical protein